MALIGCKYLVAAKGTYPERREPVYANGVTVGKLIAADIDVKFNDVPLYADNAEQESAYFYDSGTIKLGTDEIGTSVDNLFEIKSMLFGHKYIPGTDAAPPELVMSSEDEAPCLGIGYYKKGVKKGVGYYEVTWIYKAKFSPPKESAKTTEKSFTWQTPEIEGKILCLYNGDYEHKYLVKTEDEAVALLNGLAKITGGGDQPDEP